MEKRITDYISRYRCLDWAVLYMRLFAGGIMLFHNIGKIQNYNEIIGSYPAFGSIPPATAFVIGAIVESLLASLIVIGLWVRMSALILALGIFLTMIWGRFGVFDQAFVWLGIYVFLVISGGGSYGFDRATCNPEIKKDRSNNF